MNKIIFFIIVFLISSVNAKKFEVNKGNLQYKLIKEQLEKYCLNCSGESLQDFEEATLKLEKTISLNPKKRESTDKEILLSDSYDQLIYDFYNTNKSKQIIYRVKQYTLLEQLIKNSQTEKEIKLFARNLAEAYINELDELNVTFADPEYLAYKDKVNKLSKDVYFYIKKIKAQVPNKIKLLYKRANNLTLSIADLKLIDEIINDLFQIELKPKLDKRIYFKHLINTLLIVVKSNKLNMDRLFKISRAAIVLQNYHFASKWVSLDDIIWWSEVRSIEDTAEQLQFLNNQMLSTRKLDALKMLVELGEVELVIKWSKQLNFENSPTIFKLAIKQAKLRQAIIRNNKKLAQLFKQEFSQSLAEIIQNKLFDKPQYQQHIQWLIIQMGTHRQNKKFKQMLTNLAQDVLYYNKQETRKLSQTKKQKFAKKIEAQLKISDDANFILNFDGDEKN